METKIIVFQEQPVGNIRTLGVWRVQYEHAKSSGRRRELVSRLKELVVKPGPVKAFLRDHKDQNNRRVFLTVFKAFLDYSPRRAEEFVREIEKSESCYQLAAARDAH